MCDVCKGMFQNFHTITELSERAEKVLATKSDAALRRLQRQYGVVAHPLLSSSVKLDHDVYLCVMHGLENTWGKPIKLLLAPIPVGHSCESAVEAYFKNHTSIRLIPQVAPKRPNQRRVRTKKKPLLKRYEKSRINRNDIISIMKTYHHLLDALQVSEPQRQFFDALYDLFSIYLLPDPDQDLVDILDGLQLELANAWIGAEYGREDTTSYLHMSLHLMQQQKRLVTKYGSSIERRGNYPVEGSHHLNHNLSVHRSNVFKGRPRPEETRLVSSARILLQTRTRKRVLAQQEYLKDKDDLEHSKLKVQRRKGEEYQVGKVIHYPARGPCDFSTRVQQKLLLAASIVPDIV